MVDLSAVLINILRTEDIQGYSLLIKYFVYLVSMRFIEFRLLVCLIRQYVTICIPSHYFNIYPYYTLQVSKLPKPA